MYDICIIGGGVIGCAIARELSKYDLKICLLEKAADVGTGTTKANSAIVHGGYDAKHGTVKAKFSAKGSRMYKQLNKELQFGYDQIGSFVIGFNDQDKAKIEQIYANGMKNGVTDLQIVDADFVRQKEPHLNKDISVALYCPTAGIASPYNFAIALMENAIENGVELMLNAEVIKIEKKAKHFIVKTKEKEINTDTVINAAGLYADEIAKMVGINDFVIKPRKGEYLLFDKDQGNLTNSVIFQTPTQISKGVLVTRTLHGNLLIGPDATDVEFKEDVDTESKNIAQIIAEARKTLPDFDMSKVITSFAGNRAAANTGDFIIGETTVKGFINVAGIQSPGLTSAPAIAEHIAEIVTKDVPKKTKFNPYRKPFNKDLKHGGRVICRCETITEAEIRDALRRPIPITTMDAIKRRTRAGMGRCQGGFCAPKIMEIIADELNIDMAEITKKGKKSPMVAT